MENNNVQQENKMGVMPINKLLLSMSIPIIISMLVQAFYNIVDSIFVSRVSENALTAVSLAFPIQNLMIAVGIGLGVGINALVSRFLGERNFKDVNKTAMQGVLLEAVSYLLFLLFGLLGTRFFMESQTKTAEIIEYGDIYLKICSVCSFGLFMQLLLERLLQATGKTLYTMYTQGLGAVINIILDPILIFGLLGAPKMGVAGAAAATVIGQIIASILSVYFNLKKNKEIHFAIKNIVPDFRLIGKILYIGIPSILMASIGSVMTFAMNKILMGFSATAVAVFGVYFKLQSFVFMPTFGLNNGMIPILAYNYGAGKIDRIKKTIKYSVCYAVGILGAGFLVFQIVPGSLLKLFDASQEMLRIGIPALRIISISFLFAGFCIVVSSVCQALGTSIYSLIVSVARQLLVLVPVAYVMSLTGNIDLVWLSFPIAEVVSLILCIIFLKITLKATVQQLDR